MSNMKNILASIEELYHLDYSDIAIANALDIPIDFVEEAVIYLQEAAYYEDQAELEHQLIQSVVWLGWGRACAWACARAPDRAHATDTPI